ncbi:hypothetical protein NBRC116600_02590 [Thalassotalea sp. SU-HH00458]
MHLQASEIEKIQVTHARTVLSVDDNLTTDNTFLEINDYMAGQHSVAGILNPAPGLSLTGQGGLFQSYNIRGFSRARIKTEVNGIPIITDRRAGNSLSFLPAALIEHIDIKKGPSSTLYGSGAMGGVISLSTLNFNESSLNVMFKPQDDTVQTLLKLSNESLSATFMQRKANNAHAPKTATGQIKLNSQHQQYHANFASHFTWQEIEISALTMLTQGKDIGKSSAEFPHDKITLYPKDLHWLSSLQFHKKDRWRLSFFNHQQAWKNNISTFENELTSTLERRNLVTYSSTIFGGNGTILIGNTLLGGEWIKRDNIDISEREFNQANELAWQKNTIDGAEQTIGVFANHTWKLNNLSLKSGIRYDKQTVENHPLLTHEQYKVQDDFVSLSLNSHLPISTTTQLNITFANAFRFPTISELFFSGETPRGNTQGNPFLIPEKSVGLQFDYQQQLAGNFRWLISSYYYQVDNYIERYQRDHNKVIRSYRNNQEVTLKGIELTADWQTNHQLSMIFSYQKQWARDYLKRTVDDALPEELQWQINWFPAAVSQLKIENHLSYQFEKTQFGNSEQALSAEWKWHVNVNYQISAQHKINITFDNLTNNQYLTSADEDAPFHPERSIALSWQWQFH